MPSGSRRRLIHLEGQVAGLGPGCRICRPLGDVQITDDHGFTGLPATCATCGRDIAGQARVEIHVVDADLRNLLGGRPTN